LKRAVRLVAFAVAMAAIGAAGALLVSFLGRNPGGGGEISLSWCDLLSSDGFIGAYLDARAAELASPAGTDDTPVTFIVQPGQTAGEIAEALEMRGLVSDAELFRRYVQYHELDAGIEAGEYTLRQTMTIPEIAVALQRGLAPEQVCTILEGWRLEEIAAAVADQTSINETDFLALATSGWGGLVSTYGFLAQVPAGVSLEGFLFPETYRLPEDAVASDLLTRMLDTFDARVSGEIRAAAANRGLTLYDLVTLASIVEREALLDSERPLIAGVYHNRLEWASPLLNADPTIQYALGTPPDWWPELLPDDTLTDTPYNTYLYPGLPPGPICSPGLASVEAAARPAETEYEYFVADCLKEDGSHLFAVTLEEHEQNVQICPGGGY
jgi:UPF0755 protein